MPHAPLRTCLTPRCPNLVPRGYCDTHGRAGRHNYDVRKLYRTARWKALRAQVQREQPLCDDCLAAGRTEAWTDLDHIIPHRGDLVLFWDRDNLAGKCATHHAIKTQRGE